MEQLRELIKVLLGVSAIKDDMADIISDLVKLFQQLEVRCPQLSCHFHVSGVSKRTGDSFFVVVYDDAVIACDDSKRVIKTVYTHLHSKASMVMSAAIFRNSSARLSRPPAGGGARLLVKAGAPSATNKDELEAAGSTTNGERQGPLEAVIGTGENAAAALPGASDGGAPQLGADGQAPALTVPSAGGEKRPPNVTLHGHNVHDWVPPGCEGEVDLEAEEWDEDGNIIPSVASAPPSLSAPGVMEVGGFAAAGVGFAPPAVHIPSEEANDAVEALFLAVKGGWVWILRSTLTAVLLALVAFRGLASKASLQGMLVWWPLAINSRHIEDGSDSATSRRGRRGRAGDRLLPQQYPVEVQRRHNPTGERRRDTNNVVDVDYIILNEVAPAAAHQTPINEVVAMLLLLFDKEKSIVSAVFDKKLAEHGIMRKEEKAPPEAGALASITIADVLARGGFSGAPLGNSSAPASATPSDRSAATSTQATGDAASEGVSAAVAARLAARRTAGLSGQRALAAHQAAEAAKKAMRSAARTLKRSGGELATTPKKRARVESALVTRSDALASEFQAPDLIPLTDGQGCAVLVEAEMLDGHTYNTLATSWPSLEMDARVTEFEFKTASAEEWAAIAEQQKDLMVLLEETAVRRARKGLMAKME